MDDSVKQNRPIQKFSKQPYGKMRKKVKILFFCDEGVNEFTALKQFIAIATLSSDASSIFIHDTKVKVVQINRNKTQNNCAW